MPLSGKHILITGAHGFIGKNLVARLQECSGVTLSLIGRGDDVRQLSQHIMQADAIVHLAAENRPKSAEDFEAVNVKLTEYICSNIKEKIEKTGAATALIFTSSTQANLDNPYGRSKLAAEVLIKDLADNYQNPCTIFRLPGIFGKWCKPNYNSVVATFCYNIARGLPIEIHDPHINLRLAYIDDLVTAILNRLELGSQGYSEDRIDTEYSISLGALADQISSFRDCRQSLMVAPVGTGLLRALYATYISYLPTDSFSYALPSYEDARGKFVEMLKTQDSGQFSYFTALPGVTRGDHYHHSKSEKFLVIKGEALFKFQHLLGGEIIELRTSGDRPQIVDTIPGWAHNITNIGNEELIVMLWANEIFDRNNPDTIAHKV